MSSIYSQLPASFRTLLVAQLHRGLERSLPDPDVGLLAAYRSLREVEPNLREIPDTAPGESSTGPSDFSRILDKASTGWHEWAGLFSEVSAMNNPDVHVEKLSWAGISQSDLIELQSVIDAEHGRPTGASLVKLDQFRSARGFGAISAAARLGKADLLRNLLRNGASPDEPSPHGCTALHEAVIYNNIDCALLLIKAGANIEARLAMSGSEHHTCLTHAATSERLEMTEMLLKNGANIWHRQIDNLQNTPVHLCAHFGNCLSLLLDFEPRLALAQNSHGRTAVHYAAMSGNLQGVQRCHQAGADLGLPDVNGSTPLYGAFLGVIDFLSIYQIYCPTKPASQSIIAFVKSRAMLATNPGYSPWGCVGYLGKYGANPDARDRHDRTPSESAFFTLLVALDMPNGHLLQSNSLGWSQAKFNPWASSRRLR